MIPPYLHSSVRSSAEIRTFHKLASDSGLAGWYCLHSLGLAEHVSKPEGEVDFVLVGPGGVLCLEVKGGAVRRQQGVWLHTDRYGNVKRSSRSPFAQVASALYSLRESLTGVKPSLVRETLFGSGVLFPDIRFDVESPEWSLRIVYDSRDSLVPLSTYVERLLQYWRERIPGKRELSGSEVESLVLALRGDFEKVVSLRDRLSGVNEQIVRLTEGQYRALDRMEENDRVFFRGSAGTGKTLLAIEQAKRLKMQGKRVLLLCFNRILGSWLREVTSRIPGPGAITAGSIHSYFRSVISRTTVRQAFEDSLRAGDSNQDRVYGDAFLSAIGETDERYDHLILDEGQDLLTLDFFIPLDAVLEAGICGGRWSVYYDPNHQRQFFGNYDAHLVEELRRGAAEYRLDVNCRNTRPIATQVSVVSGFSLEEALVDGEKVEYIWYSSNESCARSLESLLERLVKQGIDPKDMTVLYPTVEHGELVSRLHALAVGLERIDERTIVSGVRGISHCTVQAFKGMENRVIIYAGLHGDEPWVDSVNYVGMSRAREALFVLMPETYRGTYLEKCTRYLERRSFHE
ncbi:MAG: NERD domain-containing protein [Bacillota bacterium]